MKFCHGWKGFGLLCGIVKDVAINVMLLEVGTGGVGVGMNEDGGDGKELLMHQ